MRAIAAVAWKDVRLLLHDRTGLFSTFGFPLVLAVFFAVIFAGGSAPAGALKVALVDEDSSVGSAAFAQDLASAPELEVVQTGRAEAADMVRRGKCLAFLVVKRGFGRAGILAGKSAACFVVMLAMEGALWRRFSAGELVLPCAVLLGVGGAAFAFGARTFRWMEGDRPRRTVYGPGGMP